MAFEIRSCGDILECDLPDVVVDAFLVIAGKYGNGDIRIANLKANGKDHIKVQSCVNDLYEVIERYG